MAVHPLAGKPAPPGLLIDLTQLEREYHERRPDVGDVRQLVSFGTSGHRGSALRGGAPSIVSVFAGRIADTGRDPRPLMCDAAALCREAGPDVELLWASPREVLNVRQAAECGCQIITAGAALIQKLELYDRPLEQLSLETVQMFRRDAEAAGYEL